MQDHRPNRRTIVVAGGAMLATAAVSQALPKVVRAQQPGKRKNVEALSQAELETYELAMQTVIDRSKVDPADKTGYRYWANLHNDFDTPHSGCAHFSEKFLPWHRRHLYDFEMVLRQTKPGVTDNLMIPYWDWTKPPKEGVHFPKAFERVGSALFDKRFSIAPPPWDAQEVFDMVHSQDWSYFAGLPDPSDGFGSNPGAIESGPHNTLHSNISRDMRSPGTAALDPIFWSFHAYVDLAWTRWQRLHVPPGTAQSFRDGAAKLWFLDRSFDVSSTAKLTDFNYEYEYDYSSDGPPAGPTPLALPPAASVYAAARRSIVLKVAAESGRFLTLRPEGPIGPAQNLVLRIGEAPAFREKTYQLDIYLHPASIDVSSINDAGRRSLTVRSITVWRAHHDTKIQLFARLSTAQVARLNEGWTISIASRLVVSGEDAQSLATAPSDAVSLMPTSALIGQLTIEER